MLTHHRHNATPATSHPPWPKAQISVASAPRRVLAGNPLCSPAPFSHLAHPPPVSSSHPFTFFGYPAPGFRVALTTTSRWRSFFTASFAYHLLPRSLWVSRKFAGYRVRARATGWPHRGVLATNHHADLDFACRMFREPSSTEASKGHHLKDPTAAARSTIRRQPSLRRSSRYGGSTLRGAPHLHRFGRAPFQDSMTSNSFLNRRSIGDMLAREARVLGYPMNSPHGDDPLDGSAEANRREGQRLLADAARHGQPGRQLRVPRDTTTLAELLNRPSPGDGPTSQQPQAAASEHPPFSRRFAPAIAYHSAISSDPYENARVSPFPTTESSRGVPAPQRVPQLRRVVEQSIGDLNRAGREPVVDGLGDRERSLSPDDEDHAHDAWETLLTTITPDANLPSNDSSFASTSASATNATNASRNGTAMTSVNSSQAMPPSFDPERARMILNPYPEYLNPCDYPTSSDSESDTELNLEENRRSRRRRTAPRLPFMDTLRQSHDLNSTMSSQPPISTLSLSIYDSTSDPDFQQMQAILDRLARREEIPEHWWAAAGLSRTVGRRLGAGDETPESDSAEGPSRQII